MATILVVDDQPDVRDVLGKMLEMNGHTVTVTESAESAIEAIERSVPDVLVIDQHLPGISGMELLKRVRQTPELSCLKVVMCSADDSERDAAHSAGAFGFWVKGSATIFEAVERLNAQLNPIRDPDQAL